MYSLSPRSYDMQVGRFHPFTGHEGPQGEQRYSSTLVQTSAVEGVEGSASHPGSTLLPGKTRYPLYRRLGGPQGRSGLVRKISPYRVSNPGPSSPQAVAIPTELPGPHLTICNGRKFHRYQQENSKKYEKKKRGGLESYGIKDKMTGKNILSHAIKVYRGSRGIAPLRSSTLEEGAWLTSRSGCLSLTERAPVHTEQQSAWAPQPV